MIVAAPNWFKDEYLGIEIEQYIGFGLLAIIITVVHFALLKLIDMFVRRRYAGSDLTFWDAERRRLNRGILLLTIGTVSYTHLRAHETCADLVCRLLLEKKK